MKDSINKLSGITIGLHWLIALAMIGMIAFGIYLDEMPRGPEKGELMGIHKSVGFIVLVLAVLRSVWRLANGMPKALSVVPAWQSILATLSHWLLLLGTLLMPISGLMMSVGGGRAVEVFGFEVYPAGEKIEWMGGLGHDMHGIIANVLIGLIVLHILGALKHHLIDKDGTLSRMKGKHVD